MRSVPYDSFLAMHLGHQFIVISSSPNHAAEAVAVVVIVSHCFIARFVSSQTSGGLIDPLYDPLHKKIAVVRITADHSSQDLRST